VPIPCGHYDADASVFPATPRRSKAARQAFVHPELRITSIAPRMLRSISPSPSTMPGSRARYCVSAMTLRALRAFMTLPPLVRFLWFFAMFEALSTLVRLALGT